jgi:hypothetical protein
MMGKRKSMGNDPLDWIGEQGGMKNVAAGSPGETPTSPSPRPTNGGSSDQEGLLPAPTALSLERQLLLVDGLTRDHLPKPRVNQVLWTLLLLLTMLGMGVLFFQEARKQWKERVATMEGTIERIEKEKGRNERLLEDLIVQKESVIREKQATITKIDSLHQGLSDELRTARQEAQRLQEENRNLVSRFLNPPPRREAAEASPAEPPAAPAEKPPAEPAPATPPK